ncbi:MAG: magnesium chelatase [Chlorobi bacterium]|nr:magnesium chelatase [Chlorobiota bacterium]
MIHTASGEHRPTTFGQLKDSGYQPLTVKEEMRKNLIRKLRLNEPLFPGIVGFDDTVIPQLINAILARHDILLLGLRGQAKTRIARMLTLLLDEHLPIVAGSEINDSPFAPVSQHSRTLLAQHGDSTPIEWLPRDARYGEKLATPDVTIADLIGDIDPIKAASRRLTYADEGAIHFGIIPRTNRGIFVINELPDLQPRIQVGLFNIMQEKDIQIRGFNVRMPLDLVMVFTANPQDYTNRGAIITPLKDRIDSQIITHYPRTLEDGMAITRQEAWIGREQDGMVVMPEYIEQIVEMVAMQARRSEFVDQGSGVSARMTISTMETLISNAERRAIINGDEMVVPRIVDLQHSLTGITGKVELVFEGEQEGPLKVARALIGKAVRQVFAAYFPNPLERPRRSEKGEALADPYAAILNWFTEGNALELGDMMTFVAYQKELERVPGLRDLTLRHLKINRGNPWEVATGMEFVLDGLHQNSKIAKEEFDGRTSYKDLVGTIFTGRGRFDDEEEEL